MHPTIIEAIQQRRALTVFYDGYTRMVEPHVYGINSAGHEAVSCYQIAGGSSSGKAEGWKMPPDLQDPQLGDNPAEVHS